MKLSKLFFGVAAAAMFAACSSDDIVAEKTQVQLNEDGTGYMALNISMPVQGGVRGVNDDFAHGLAAEYEVKNVTLVMFSDGKFHSAYDITNTWSGSANSVANGNVTADNKYIAKIQGEKLVNPTAFVVLNHNDIFTVDESNHTLLVDGVSAVGKTFDQILPQVYSQTLDLQASQFHKAGKGFLMMNAPLEENQGGSVGIPAGDIYTLTPVKANQVYPTEQAAKDAANGTVSIYVERAVAKVTLTSNITEVATDFVNATVAGWTLDNTNTQSNICRTTEGFDSWKAYTNDTFAAGSENYRMTGTETVKHDNKITEGLAGAVDAYRTYFAKDPNYGTAGTFNSYTAIDGAVGTDKPQYCAENTFDIERMIYKETTRAIIKMTLNDGNDFYSRPGDDKLYSATDMQTVAANKLQARAGVLKAAGALGNTGTITFTGAKVDDKNFKATPDVALVKSSTATPAQEAEIALINAGITYGVIELGYEFYDEGAVYYDTRIKHFGDELTPWSVTGEATTVAQSYGTDMAKAEKNWLGRWGVLRNNWYQLNVTAVNKMGYATPNDLSFDPTVPEWPDTPDPDTPDDNQKDEQWINVDVNILSWAVRTQDVKF